MKTLLLSPLEVIEAKLLFQLLQIRAFSRPFVPLRQLSVFHLASANMRSAAIENISGTWCFRAHPRTLVTGQ
jgi:hypothetical protein